MRFGKLAALAVNLSLFAGSAQAAVITFTYTGTIQHGIDVDGLFGAAGANLAGLGYTSTYALDDLSAVTDDNGGIRALGGTFVGAPSILVYGEVKVGDASHKLTVADEYTGYVLGNTIGHYTGLYYFAASSVIVTADSPISGISDEMFNQCYTLPSATPHSGACIDLQNSSFRFGNTEAFVSTDYVSIDPSPTLGVTYVPEPATWAMMIAGFGMVGASLRRRRELAA